jgi:hypothetical protein
LLQTDFAKYDLNSTGEYTQGAGALAMLLPPIPELLHLKTIGHQYQRRVLISLNRTEPFLKKKSLAMQQMNLGLTSRK